MKKYTIILHLIIFQLLVINLWSARGQDGSGTMPQIIEKNGRHALLRGRTAVLHAGRANT